MDFGPIFRAMLRHKVKFALIVIEIALTLAIVANCATMILQALRTQSRPSGFDDDNLVTLYARPLDVALNENGLVETMFRQDRDAIRSAPGVRAVMNTYFAPWSAKGFSVSEVQLEGGAGPILRVQRYPTDEGLLPTLGVSLVEGRMFTTEEIDEHTARGHALDETTERLPDGSLRIDFIEDLIITRAFAQHAFGDGPYVGRLLDEPQGGYRHRVVGVIDPFYKPVFITGKSIAEYAVFYPARAYSYFASARFLVRTEPGRAAAVARDLQQRLQRPGQAREIHSWTIAETRAAFFGPQRLVATSMGIVIVLLVLVTSLGVAGLTSFSVSERTRQIGTRRALGATTQAILRYFLVESSLVMSGGLALGAALAVALNMVVVSTIMGAAELDYGLLALSIALLGAVGLGSAIAPALRGARISPALATRNI